MTINSLRFGPIEVPEDKVIKMERPILGFESLRTFCMIEMEELVPFHWLQSTEDPAVAFLVFNPVLLFPDYRIEINSNEIAELDVVDVTKVETYVVVTIPEDPQRMSANLQGPILVNTENRRAKQLVLVNSRYQVRHSIFDMLESNREPEYQEYERQEELVSV